MRAYCGLHAARAVASSSAIINNGGTLDMAGFSDGIAGLSSASGNSAGIVLQGTGNLSLSGTSGTNTFAGTITGTGTFTKNGGCD